MRRGKKLVRLHFRRVHGVHPMSMEDNRVAVSIFSVLAERDRRFSVVEGDNSIRGLPFSTYALRGREG